MLSPPPRKGYHSIFHLLFEQFCRTELTGANFPFPLSHKCCETAAGFPHYLYSIKHAWCRHIEKLCTKYGRYIVPLVSLSIDFYVRPQGAPTPRLSSSSHQITCFACLIVIIAKPPSILSIPFLYPENPSHSCIENLSVRRYHSLALLASA